MKNSDNGKKFMSFDWDKAASILKEEDIQNANAGLLGDWRLTKTRILFAGKPVESKYFYNSLSSIRAIPTLEFNGKKFNCFKMKSEVSKMGGNEVWPMSALKILNRKPLSRKALNRKVRIVLYRYAFGVRMYDQDCTLSVCRECLREAWLPENVLHKRKCTIGSAFKILNN